MVSLSLSLSCFRDLWDSDDDSGIGTRGADPWHDEELSKNGIRTGDDAINFFSSPEAARSQLKFVHLVNVSHDARRQELDICHEVSLSRFSHRRYTRVVVFLREALVKSFSSMTRVTPSRAFSLSFWN